MGASFDAIAGSSRFPAANRCPYHVAVSAWCYTRNDESPPLERGAEISLVLLSFRSSILHFQWHYSGCTKRGVLWWDSKTMWPQIVHANFENSWANGQQGWSHAKYHFRYTFSAVISRGSMLTLRMFVLYCGFFFEFLKMHLNFSPTFHVLFSLIGCVKYLLHWQHLGKLSEYYLCLISNVTQVLKTHIFCCLFNQTVKTSYLFVWWVLCSFFNTAC